MNPNKKDNLHNQWIQTLAILIAGAGAFFIICWWANIPEPLSFLSAYRPLPFSSAWCILFSGLGLWAVLRPSRFLLKECCAIPILLISLWRLLEYIFHHDLAMSGFFLKLLPYSPPVFPPITIFAASGFAIVSLLLFCWPRSIMNYNKSSLIIILSSLLTLLGIIKFLPTLLPTFFFIGWNEAAFGHPFTSLSLIMLGFAFASRYFYINIYKKINTLRWISIFSSSFSIIISFLISQSIVSESKSSIQHLLESKIASAEYQYQLKIDHDFNFLARFSHQIAQHGTIPSEWIAETQSFMKKNREIHRIYCTDQNFIVQKDYLAASATGRPIILPNELQRHFTESLSAPTPLLSIRVTEGMLLLCTPLIRDRQFQGVCIAEVSLATLFRPIAEYPDHEFILNILYENTIIYSSKINAEILEDLSASKIVNVENLSLTFYLHPAKGYSEYIIHQTIQYVILMIGILLSIFLGLLIYLWNFWRQEARTNQRMIRFFDNLLIAFKKRQSVKDACRQLLALINELSPWETLILWQLNLKSRSLQFSELVYSSFIELPNFKKYLEETASSCRYTLAEQVLIHKKTIAIADLSQNTEFPCSCAAKSDKIKGTLAFPLFEGDNPIGVMILFRKDLFVSELEPELMNLLQTIGIEFGQYLQRNKLIQFYEESVSLIENSAEAIYTLDLDGAVKTWNPGAERMYGWSAAEMIGQNIFAMTIPPENVNELAQCKKNHRDETQVLNWESQRKRKDGSLIWVSINTSPIRDDEGKIIGSARVVRDITAQKNALIQLSQHEEKLRHFIESSEEWIWEMDLSGHYTFSNQGVRQILNITPAELIGLDIYSFLSPEDQQKIQKEWEYCILKKIGWHCRQISMKKRNGAIVWVESTGTPFFNENGEIIGFRGADRDITDRINIDQKKNEFISIISHELRTPLTSIVGSLGLLTADRSITAKNAELIALANRNAQRLTRILNDVLDIEKIQLGKLQLNIQKISCAKAIRESIDITQSFAAQMQVAIIEKSMLEEIIVNADRDRLIQIMLNLLTNAIKFSPPNGKVTVWMERIDDRVRVSIQDVGKGIPPEFQSRIFEKFQQADQTDARSVGGTGLGLNICKNLLKLMGGSIYFKTEQNIGTVFYFELPIAG
ncbi:MAG: domain S-box protein [Parachlamydiales bacterium]|nr:domain S-box protein [Parachlamydiales bacterium]